MRGPKIRSTDGAAVRWVIRFGRPIVAMACVAAFCGCANNAAFRRGEGLLRAGDPDSAVRSFESALEADPNNVEYRVRLLQAREAAVYRHEKEGEECLLRDDLDGAIHAFQQAVDLEPLYDAARRHLDEAFGRKRTAAGKDTSAVSGPDEKSAAGTARPGGTPTPTPTLDH